MHLFHIPQCSILNRNVHISVLNGALWDMEHMHQEICELGQLLQYQWGNTKEYMEKEMMNPPGKLCSSKDKTNWFKYLT